MYIASWHSNPLYSLFPYSYCLAFLAFILLIWWTHIILLAGDIELNPDPVPKECSANPKRICKSKDRFMAVVFSMSAELLVNETVHTVYVCFKNSNSDIPPSAFKVAKHQKR